MKILQATTYVMVIGLIFFIAWMVMCGGGGGCENAWWRAY